MIGILVTSHGPFCEALIKTGEMITGKHDNVSYILLNDKGVNYYAKKLEEKLNLMFEEYDGVVILCDIKGGTPCNESLKYALTYKKNLAILAGVNLPTYLEIVNSISFIESIPELMNFVKQTCLNTVEIIEL
ncbi:PTS sugar transporter subunit IIA [Virgibacillus pantothenticus]|uniref:PTS EIIA type-4 domain-containing protein n=1 Tax=Virgibacillus pantothenticus TaxID=1473 RepID=A0A0L0QUB6_VIRPA|nr:hypothetical protein [Virgibacillus pantothenticus]KNE21808.1 hypothetical protein AFK71_03040 [Virgibacillus pantothenticus]MED3739074.1 hypothetical protein [Virgibacillus pantothenticus]QTY17051.1 hypothetical protein KBP50_03880 [Virgibacillus pantothenticus]SIT12560.1 PTS system, N-acetylgalactosamine-specific IIA component/PTS system, mannose-specific IIA component/PTS system, mannose-specific IIB component [Virgibacillus pantothenticus]